jgi:hypothetical protein
MITRRLLATLCLALPLALGVRAGDLAVRAARASVVRPQSFEDLVDRSRAVVVGVPAEQTSIWEGGRIVTYTRVAVVERVAGEAEDSLWVRTLGGEVGDLGQRVDGEATLTIGAPTLLFLERAASGTYAVAARAQGQFLVEARSSGRVLRPHPSMGAFMTKGPKDIVVPAADRLKTRALDEAARDIRARWEKTHARR